MSTHTQKMARQHNSLRRKKQSAGEQEAALPDTTSSNILHLQRLIGNQGVQRLIAQQQSPSPLIAPVSAHPVQHHITRTAAPASIQRDFFDDASEWVEDKASGAEEWVEEKANDVSEGVSDAGEWVEEKANDAGEWVEEKANDVSEGVNDAGEWVEEKADDAGEWVEEKANDAGEWVEEKANDVSEGVNDAGEWVEEKANDAGEWVEEKADDAGEWVEEKANDAGEWVEEKANDISEGAEEAKEWVEEKANDLGLDHEALVAMVKTEFFAQVTQQVPAQTGIIPELNDLDNYWDDNGVPNAVPSFKDMPRPELARRITEQERLISGLEADRIARVKKARADARLTIENFKAGMWKTVLISGALGAGSGLMSGLLGKGGSIGLLASLVGGIISLYVDWSTLRDNLKALLANAKLDLRKLNTSIKVARKTLEAMKKAAAPINVEDLPDANPPINPNDLPDANPPIDIDDLPDAK